MTDPRIQAATQLANIETATGTTLAQFTAAIADSGLTSHGHIVSYLKTEHGLTHGNANLIAQLARDELAGGAPSPAQLLDDQYRGTKAPLRPIYEELASIASSLGDDVETLVQKTGVSFRRGRRFAHVRAASATRIRLGLKLNDPSPDPRLRSTTGMCNHTADITDLEEIDDALAGYIAQAYNDAV